jgi:hypothetical protein
MPRRRVVAYQSDFGAPRQPVHRRKPADSGVAPKNHDPEPVQRGPSRRLRAAEDLVIVDEHELRAEYRIQAYDAKRLPRPLR